MMRFLKTFVSVGSFALAAQTALAFSLGGPINEAYQVGEIGYNLGGDLVAPKNLGEEYRRNTPLLYYSFDANFLDYFGSNGVAAVEQAIEVFNRLPKTSQMSVDLSEWPTATMRENDTATALSLWDLKSWTMRLLCEQLGLAEPERYIWTLHTRNVGAGGCPDDVAYSIIQRNFNPGPSPLNQYQSTPYVNGVLYTYFILETCVPPNPLAIALPLKVDPADQGYTAVAGGDDFTGSSEGFFPGSYYLGLTRDDVAGLKYLMQTNNMNVESAGPGTFTYVTNTVPQLLVTSNLMFVAEASLTNAPGAMQALFPGLVVAASTSYFTNVMVPNVISYFTNSPYDPVGTPPQLVYATNYILTVQTHYKHTFENLYTVLFTNNQWVAVQVPDATVYTADQIMSIQTIEVGNSPYAPVGSPLVTNVSYVNFVTNYYAGEYFILPTNSCEIAILGLQATFNNIWTNYLSGSLDITTNTAATNSVGSTNAQLQSLITYSTNHAFVVLPITCETNTTALRQGIEKVSFARRHYDSLLGTFFEPTTNFYVLNSITNSRIVPQRVQRPILFPDFLFTAQDLASGPGAAPAAGAVARNINFSTNAGGAYFGLAGPGTIETTTGFIYNKVGPIWAQHSSLGAFTYYPNPEAEYNQIPLMMWGSFDGSTNVPTVYPNGTSIENLENMVLVTFNPPLLSAGILGQPYQATFTASGMIAPLVWSLAPGSPALPPGLTLSPGGVLSGIPTQDDTFDFVVRVTDSSARSVDRAYSLTINPQ